MLPTIYQADNTAIIETDTPSDRVGGLIAAWLHECRQTSGRTAQAYGDYVSAFRSTALAAGLDLLPSERRPSADVARDHADTIAYAAQSWAERPNARNGRPISKSTHNLRLAAIASFYTYAIHHHEMPGPNPLDMVKRLKRPMYAGVEPLPYADGEIDAALAAITDGQAGRRDRALLAITLYTGRRLTEVASMRYGDLAVAASQVVIQWPHLKGDKVGKNIIRHDGGPAYAALMAWLTVHPLPLLPDTIIFPSLSRNHYGHQMTPQAIEGIAARWMGTTRFHRLRHTFAAVYLAAGGNVQGLSAALSHSNLGVTSVYAHALTDGDNEHQADMADVFAGKKKGGRHAS